MVLNLIVGTIIRVLACDPMAPSDRYSDMPIEDYLCMALYTARAR